MTPGVDGHARAIALRPWGLAVPHRALSTPSNAGSCQRLVYGRSRNPFLRVVRLASTYPSLGFGLPNDVQILQYDIGVEWDMVRELENSWLFKPFIGIGVGARTYLYANDNLQDQTCAAGYGAVGAELQFGRTALRLEGRDNIFCYKSALPNVKSKTRNDVGLSLGLAYHFR